MATQINTVSPHMTGYWRWGLLSVVLLTAFVLLPSVGSVMHETDQAALLNGAWQLAHGTGESAVADFHHFGQQYIAYWLLAALLKTHTNIDAVGVANAMSFGLWWCTALFLCWSVRVRVVPTGIVLISAILVPSSLVHSPYLATIFISGALLCLAGVLTLNRSSGWGTPLAMAVVFLAVGVRADAVLVLPLLIWLSVRRPSLRSIFRSPVSWGFLLAGLGALMLGGVLSRDFVPNLYQPTGSARVFVALLVFGLGGAAVALLLAACAIGLCFSRQRQERTPFLLVGLVALLLPMAFYSFQMFSTRHWTQTVVGLLLFCAARRGQAMLAVSWRKLPVRLLGYTALVSSVVPLAIGVHLPFPDAPSAAIVRTTRFPTADGHVPMGGYMGLIRDRALKTQEGHDHNEAIWLAARGIQEWARDEPSGQVPVFQTPMANYLVLAARAVGERPVLCPPRNKTECGHRFHYADLRSLVRADSLAVSVTTYDRREMLKSSRIQIVGAKHNGQAIVRIWSERGAGLPTEYALSELFAGCEFVVIDRDLDTIDDIFVVERTHIGKTIVLFADHPFCITREDKSSAKETICSSQEIHGLHAVTLKGKLRLKAGTCLRGDKAVSNNIHIAHSILPDYMSVQQGLGDIADR